MHSGRLAVVLLALALVQLASSQSDASSWQEGLLGQLGFGGVSAAGVMM